MNILIICITIIIIVVILCATSIYIREKQRYEEVITSNIFRKLQEEHDKLLGECKAIKEYSHNSIKNIDNEFLDDKFKINFCRTSYCTIYNLLYKYE